MAQTESHLEKSQLDDLSFEPLTPLAFLRRSAFVHRERPAVADAGLSLTYGEMLERTSRLAGALREIGLTPGARVAVLAPNTHLMLESHYGVPAAGCVLVSLNIRLSSGELGYIIGHSGAQVVLYDDALEPLVRGSAVAAGTSPRLIGSAEYEQLIAAATSSWSTPQDERGLLAINYTSGTTGKPKGVMYHHRGAYLQALAMIYHAGLQSDSVFLWTLPMFHCNGWCFTWGVTAAAARHVCLRRPDPAEIWRLIDSEGVTHLCAAPTVLGDLASQPDAHAPARPLKIATGGAPPSPALLSRFDELGIEVTHLYGLTETFGPVMVCDWKPEWNDLPAERRARLKARQGVGNVIALEPRVLLEDGSDAPDDGQTAGEIAVRGNDVMLGYYRDTEATVTAAPDGWFRTGDVGVMHDDGYVELRDRSKDVIISGGENIASVEVEQTIASHPAVLEVAVVGRPDERYGERPVAFVRLAPGRKVAERDLIDHVRDRLAHFKAPSEVHFVEELPRTATGKIQKFVLRDQLRAQSS